MKRRDFSAMLLSAMGGSLLIPGLLRGGPYNNITVDFLDKGLPKDLPENMKTMMNKTLELPFSKVNTDWFGSIQVEGMLRFAKRGYKRGYEFAKDWFNYHLEHDGKLSDEEYYAQYQGNDARILRDGPMTFAIYSGILGLAFPVHELYLMSKDPTAKRVCFDVAEAILHYAARDRFGMLAHDDFNFTKFAIPDTAYWATRATAIAASLSTGDLSSVYWKQAIYQLEQGIKYFLDREKKIVRTGLFNGKPGKTYWCRSQGWLLWAIGGMLRYLPPGHPKFKVFSNDMELIAEGIKKYQSKNGALHVLVDDPSSPEEVTSITMVLSVLKEGHRKGWIKGDYEEMFSKAWNFIQNSVDNDGNIHNAYTGWAVPAERGHVNNMDTRQVGYARGIVMVAADEMTK